MTRPLSKSRFRPGNAPDATILQEHAPLLRDIERRGVLRGSLSLGALAMLGGCSPKDSETIQATLRAVSRFNDRVQAWLFDPTKLAPTYPESMVLKPPRFNAFYEVGDVNPVDAATWKLELAGRIAERQPWTVPQIMALPEQEIIIRHICVEGWDYIGQWSGVSLRLFLERVGADLSCRYVAFRCADGYWGSIDMASALHPQTLLATKYAREAIADPFGYPLRLRTAVKLGFKNPKWITSIEVTNDYPGGYWEDRGFNWFSGL
ncbi:molybdopterin-dependent oxidoreductase [Roseococcus sp.]|uniref:molybdopterin-dependent oxidoreductase n=1 Tax=Roseococcus sp. TaxID=2109646 RepID=UPI003BA8AB20